MSYFTTGPILFGDTNSPTYWFTSLPCPLLLGPAKWSSFDRRLNRLDTIGPPHILPIDRCNYWLIIDLICEDMKHLCTYCSTSCLLKNMQEIAWAHGMPVVSHFLQLQCLFSMSTVKLCSPFLTSNCVWLAQQANHLLLAVFSLCNPLSTLGHISDSTLMFFCLLSWNLVIRYNLMDSSCNHTQVINQIMYQIMYLTNCYLKA